MMQDFPAAHSMDTNWFAVDADGHVAVFDSGEAGALPEGFRKSPWMYDGVISFLEQLAKYNNGIITLEVDAIAAAQGTTLEEIQGMVEHSKACAGKPYGWTPEKLMTVISNITHPQFEEAELHYLLLIFSAEDSIKLLQPHTDILVRFSRSSNVVFVNRCLALQIEHLIMSGKIIAGKSFDPDRECQTLGLFSYSHGQQWENWVAGPYVLEQNPKQALKLEDLPEELQNSISWIWFDKLRFSETTQIQPIEHTKCDTWRSNTRWFDTNGQEHEEHPH